MKKVAVLGSTGSLGVQTLKVLQKYRRHFKVSALAANKNTVLLSEQAAKFQEAETVLISRDGEKSLSALIAEADIVINVLSGIAGLESTIAAVKAGKILLLGNKESLVAEGKKTMRLAKTNGKSRIIPLDSEHNAVYEILQKFPGQTPRKIILPCSGGPFHKFKTLDNITPEQALAHPRWKMGQKISLESATLINKGFEIIEAYHLFGVPIAKIEVVIHPECKIHGMVKFIDRLGTSTIGYFAESDMQEHIENALLRAINLSPPQREIRQLRPQEFSFQKSPTLLPGIELVLNSFRQNRQKKFLRKEEQTLRRFLDGKIKFSEIFKQLERV